VVLSFYFSVLIFKTGHLRNYLLAGLFAGFAASTKYHGALVAAAVPVAYLLGTEPVGLKGLIGPVAAAAAAVAGFLLGTPYALLDRQTFLFKEDPRGFLWQFQNMKGHLGAEAVNGWWFHFSVTLREGLGLPLLVLAVGGILLSLYRHRRRDLLLLSFPLFYFLYVGSWRVVYGRYMIPILPFLCLLAAALFCSVADGLRQHLPMRRFSSPFLSGVFLLLVLVQPLWQVLDNDYLLIQKDTRTLAKEWIDDNLPDKSKIAMDTIYGFFLDPFYLPSLRKATGPNDPEKGFYLYPWSKISTVSPHEDPKKFLADWKKEGIDYLVTSSLVYARYFNKETEKLRPGVIDTQRDYRWFAENFRLLKEFSPQGVRPGPVIRIYKVR
jgi:hypothetical protein